MTGASAERLAVSRRSPGGHAWRNSLLLGAAFSCHPVVLLALNCSGCLHPIRPSTLASPLAFLACGFLAGLLAQWQWRNSGRGWRTWGLVANVALAPMSYLAAWATLLVAGSPTPGGLEALPALLLMLRIAPGFPAAALEPTALGLVAAVLCGVAPFGLVNGTLVLVRRVRMA